MRNHTRNVLLATVFIGLFSPLKVNAQYAVFDASNYAQSIEQVVRMQELISKTEQEINALQSQLEAMEGSRGMGSLLGGNAQQDLLRYAPKNWQDTLKILEAGGNPGSLSDLQNIYQQNSDLFKHLSNESINSDNPNAPNLAAYGYARDTTLGSMALSETAFNKNDDRISNYESLIGEIDSAADIKAAADLANRISAENGLTQAELIRLQATQIQLNAASANQNIKNQSDLYEFSNSETDMDFTPVNP